MYEDQWQRALSIIKEVGISRLANFDGCLCSSFAVQGVEVDISCRKSIGAGDHRGYVLRVHSNTLGSPVKELKDIAHEVARQIREIDPPYAIKIRYADWAHDVDKGRKCCWCGELREDAESYLCNAHSTNADALASYDFGPTEIIA
jgi:hypothetical protein